MSEIPYKIYLSEKEIPTAWYNVRADMKNKPAPLLNPGTGEALKAEDLYPIFCEELSKQEMNETDSGSISRVRSLISIRCTDLHLW
jgi:tryptophan synthase beta chain